MLLYAIDQKMENRIETIKARLTELGMVSEPTEDEEWLMTRYNDIAIRYLFREKEDYLTMAIAIDCGTEDIEGGKVLALFNRINRRIRYVKAFEEGGYFWLAYEKDVGKSVPDTLELLKMVVMLNCAYYHFWDMYDQVIGLEDDSDDPGDGLFNWNDYLSKGMEDDEG